jgi:hypothetical protein
MKRFLYPPAAPAISNGSRKNRFPFLPLKPPTVNKLSRWMQAISGRVLVKSSLNFMQTSQV